jgi:hypothetical protein
MLALLLGFSECARRALQLGSSIEEILSLDFWTELRRLRGIPPADFPARTAELERRLASLAEGPR